MKSSARASFEMKKTGNADARQQQGICSSCENLSLCSFVQPVRQPVFFCEEFTSGSDRIAPVAVKTRSDAQVPRDTGKGLCATCDDAKTCLYSKDESASGIARNTVCEVV
jgi:hypothetical protein